MNNSSYKNTPDVYKPIVISLMESISEIGFMVMVDYIRKKNNKYILRLNNEPKKHNIENIFGF